MRRSIPVCFILFFVITVPAIAQHLLPYQNPSLPVEQRVSDLLPRMTPEEKFRQLFMIPGDLKPDSTVYKPGLFGFQVNTDAGATSAAAQMLQYREGNSARETARKINGIQQYFMEESRLGIPIIAFDEALHGLVRRDATVFPQAIGLAASWNPDLLHQVAGAIASECRSRGIRQILSPVVNLATDPRWGRTEETYGEDPVLAAAMGVAFVSAFEKNGVVATPKHFAVNHGDGGRDSYPIHFDERLLEETYLVPFKACVQKGGARSIMTAYNSLSGSPCSANNWLLNQKLKKEWGFRGFVISDAGATGGANVLHFTAADYASAGKNAVENGQDVIFQTAFQHHSLFDGPFLRGNVDSVAFNDAVARVLRVKFELGLFEQPYADAYEAAQEARSAEHVLLAKQAALQSFVLLKNDNQTLPLPQNLKSIAVVGTDAMEGRTGGYSGPGGDHIINLLEGIKEKLGNQTLVRYEPGCGRKTIENVVISEQQLSHRQGGNAVSGLSAEYFNNADLSGQPALLRIDKTVDFQWTLFSPDPSINYDFFSVRWTGMLTAPETGTFNIGIEGNDGFRLYLDNRLLLDKWQKQTYVTALAPFFFEKGKSYPLRIEYREPAGNARFRLVWNLGVSDNSEQKIAAAVSAAAKSDAVIVVAGIEEGEFQDRNHLNLPGRQEELITRIAATGKPVIVLLSGGSAVTMGKWLDKVRAVLNIWYPGEQGGFAVADVLFGDYCPGGKLPLTYPHNEGQLPLVYNHKPTGRGDDYADGTGQALFPFGFGLSYTTFEYTNLIFNKKQISAGDTISVSFTLTNSGRFAGDEVVQLYLRDELSSVAQPLIALKDFQRVHLAPGESGKIQFSILPEMCSMLDRDLKTVIEPGFFRIMIGSSSKDIRLPERFEVVE